MKQNKKTENKERAKMILHSIGDAVIATDTEKDYRSNEPCRRNSYWLEIP